MYGHSAVNFSTAGPSSPSAPLGLQGQIAYFLDLLRGYVGDVREGGERVEGREGGESGGGEVRVVLVGHSVGAYIALEVLRRVQEEDRKRSKNREGGREEGIRVVGVVGLWPTVTHIARSDSGVRMGVSAPN